MAIVARQEKSLTDQERAAFLKFFKDNPALGQSESPESTHNAKALLKHLAGDWRVVIDEESIRAGFKALSEIGALKLRSVAQQKYDQALKNGNYTQAHQDILDRFLQQVHLVSDPNDDRTFENCAAIFNAMRGYDFTSDNLLYVMQYLQGKGVKLFWSERKDPNKAIEFRAHRFDRNDPNAYRFAPKTETNRPSFPSHSGNRYLNGQEEREKREAERQRFGKQPDDVVAAQHLMWRQMVDRAIAEGRTHSERNRIEQAARQAPGGLREQAEVAHREAALVRRDRERGR